MNAPKNTDNTPMTLPMFDLDAIPKQDKPEPATRWYYITRWRDQEMLHYVSSDGTAVWCEHDTHAIQPMVFNSKRTADIEMRRVGGDNVKRWFWRVENRAGGK